MVDHTNVEIDLSLLIGKLNHLQETTDGDLARMIELLLLENHILSLGQSSGYRRGAVFDFSQIPRFLKLDGSQDPAVDVGEEGDLAQ